MHFYKMPGETYISINIINESLHIMTTQIFLLSEGGESAPEYRVNSSLRSLNHDYHKNYFSRSDKIDKLIGWPQCEGATNLIGR